VSAEVEQTSNVLRVKRVREAAQLPAYQTAGAACFDLHAVIDPADEQVPGAGIIIAPGGAHTFNIGLVFEVPDGKVMKVYSRSGHGFKHGIRLANGTGIIDSDFRGEMLVRLQNDSPRPFTVFHGDRVAQCMLEPAPQWELIEVDELTATARGEAGFGSTGA
jgi:dUTP pyrophosphatase